MEPSGTSQQIDATQRCENDPFVSGTEMGASTFFITIAALVAIGAWWIGNKVASRVSRWLIRVGGALFVIAFGLSTFVSTKQETNGLKAACYAQAGCENTCMKQGDTAQACADQCSCMVWHIGRAQAKPEQSPVVAYGTWLLREQPRLSPTELAAIVQGARQACPPEKNAAEP